MQYRVFCTDEARELIPAVVHRDNTARPQVVYRDRDPWLHDLLTEYGRLTGVECLVNTSLNVKGRPIVNTYEDAVNEFRNRDIRLVSLPHEAWSLPDPKAKYLI